MRAARCLVLSAALLFATVRQAPAVPADAGGPQLVILGEPRPPADLASSRGAVTLTYGIVEVFAGEPGTASVVVRHESLGAADRARLAAGDQAIVVASPDPDRPGRWTAPVPLRATDRSVEALRRWGAPEDVREARPLSEVLAEMSGAAPAVMAGTPEEPVGRIAEEAAAPPSPIESEDVPERAAWPEPARVEPAPARPAPARVEPEPARAAPSTSSRARATLPEPRATPARVSASRVGWAPSRDPSRASRDLVPTRGPGLPPPPPFDSLGPPLEQRTDLPVPPLGSR